MSKADQLGAGRFGTARGVSSRRAAIGAATGVPTEGVAPPTTLPVGRISPNPDNPRTSLGDLTELGGSLKEHGQKQAITVMNRDAYVKANPEREGELEPDTTHVVVDGSSRLAAAREAGLPHLKVMVDDEQGSDADEILESALVANVHRQALEPLDEAHALQRLLAIHGTQTALAKRLHKSQGWVSQRLALLNLTPELKERIGREPVDLLRAVGNKPAEQQEAALEKLKRQQARDQAEKAARRSGSGQGGRSDDNRPRTAAVPAASAPAASGSTQPSGTQPPTTPASTTPASKVSGTEVSGTPGPSPVGEDYYGVIEEPERKAAAEAVSASAGGRAAAPASAEAVPEPRAGGQPDAGARSDAEGPAGAAPAASPRLPYDDGYFIAQHLIRKMPAHELDKMLALLNEHQQQRNSANAEA
ncbi:ParB/RepB/Spo0J family partition protein [Streptomyces sp. NPDC050703]|uniref:ParB/RepB/Spo0J family partition protein n=1 Tax=Streptomyces sp. NPDC050703 TaxID=3157218 RepID=UPI0034460155